MVVHSVKQHLLSGSSFQNFIVLLFNNRFQVSWEYLPRIAYVTFTTLLLLPIHLLEFLIYNKRIEQTKLLNDPIFIIGHCRSGTTYLHNLLCQDKQFAFPSTYQCFLPGVFLTGKGFLKSVNQKTLPSTRPMDNVKMHPDFPQEEEFALVSLTPFSYYQSLFFPMKMISHFKSFALMESVSIARWKKCYFHFLKKVSLINKGKQLLLKNPVNTVRIQHLLKMFPQAKFIYISRTKEEVLRSTYKLYIDLLSINSFQRMSAEVLRKNIAWIYKETISQYDNQKPLISPSHLVEVHYSDLIERPLFVAKRIYTELNIYGFENSSTQLNEYIFEQAGYVRNHYNV